MEFKTVQEAFNYWNGKSLKEIETRAQEVKGMIETDPDVNITALNIELTGLAEAKANAEDKAQAEPEARSFNPVTGANFTGSVANKVTGDVYASPEYRSAFYKNLMGKELTGAEKVAFDKAREIETRSDAYTTSGNSPVVIPTQTLNEVVKKARTMGGLMAEVRAFAVPSKIAVPVATPASKAVWNTEGADVETDKPTIAQVTFDANEIIKVFSISAKVKTMSIDAFEAYLTD
jgi:HK97 family phage major capsid protein